MELGDALDFPALAREIRVQIELGHLLLDHDRQMVCRNRVRLSADSTQEARDDIFTVDVDLLFVVVGTLLEASRSVPDPLHRSLLSVRLNALNAAFTCLGVLVPARTSAGYLPARKYR